VCSVLRATSVYYTVSQPSAGLFSLGGELRQGFICEHLHFITEIQKQKLKIFVTKFSRNFHLAYKLRYKVASGYCQKHSEGLEQIHRINCPFFVSYPTNKSLKRCAFWFCEMGVTICDVVCFTVVVCTVCNK